MEHESPYRMHLGRNPANHRPLTPLSFVARAASVYRERTALIHGDRRWSWAETWARSLRLASALRRRGIGRLDTVAILAPNAPPMLEAHYGVPAAGAVLNAINTRLDAETIAFILEHGEAKAFIVDRELAAVAHKALAGIATRPLVVLWDDPLGAGGERIGDIGYEELLAEGDPDFAWLPPEDEWEAIALNYTSGTTGNPKGVVVHHRGAYLTALGNIPVWGYPNEAVYLWTLPLFHCNGWCFPWTNAATGAANVTIRRVDAAAILDAIQRHGVTHFCGAPIVLALVAEACDRGLAALPHPVSIMTAAAPPRVPVLRRLDAAGFSITHVYGLTEVYGPAVHCAWQRAWDALDASERVRLKARQGVPYPVLEEVAVLDPATLAPVPGDGETVGEVMMRGNVVMMGYFKNPAATDAAFEGGWFHSGDLGIMHPDGYLELKDRAKDIIISGGENISSLEVEAAILRHEAVADVAVVARPDPVWGEHPCAFVVLHPEVAPVDEATIVAFARGHLAHFKAPRTVVFCELPRNAAGKVDKKALREMARAL